MISSVICVFIYIYIFFFFCFTRLFSVLVSLSQQSPSVEPVITSFLSLLDGLLVVKDLKVDTESIDLTLVGWLLLLLAHVLDNCIVQSKPPKPVKGQSLLMNLYSVFPIWHIQMHFTSN